MKTVAGLVVASVLLAPGLARADSFALDGAFTTEGVFTCLKSLACAGSGTNTLTLGSGANTATLTFNGVDTTLGITNVATPVKLGQFQTSSGPGFTFPTRPNPNIPIIRFDFIIHQSSPVSGTRDRVLSFGPGGKSDLPLMMGDSYVRFSLPPSTTPGRNYTGFVYSFAPFPFKLSANGTTDFSANVGVVPEPGSMLLVGGGLAAALARRRKRAMAQTAANV
jgi:PEP-CTERM motif